MSLEAAIKDLQDAMVVMAHLEKRQSERLHDHDQYIAELQEYQRRTDQKLAEIADKLDGLIGYVDHESVTHRRRAEEVEELLEFRRRTEQNLAEITDKLNRMAGPLPPPS